MKRNDARRSGQQEMELGCKDTFAVKQGAIDHLLCLAAHASEWLSTPNAYQCAIFTGSVGNHLRGIQERWRRSTRGHNFFLELV
jgi:hypothetical protein